MYTVKEVAERLDVSERLVRRILRELKEDKKHHEYYWMFDERELNQVIKKIENKLN